MTSQRLGLYIIFILMCLRDFNLNTLQQNCNVKALQFGYFLLSYKKKKTWSLGWDSFIYSKYSSVSEVFSQQA